jgi:hypothetical protein
MYNIQGVESLFHRSKERIRDMGEVFTPEKYVQEMLSILYKNDNNIWTDPSISFFEPCCGHGNFVVEIIKNRLKGLYKFAVAEELSSPELYSVANTINSIWAIDLDVKNVKECQRRVFELILLFMSEGTGCGNKIDLIKNNREYFTHLICAINWHIFDNETLSSLSDKESACHEASKTKSGTLWIAKNHHDPIDFDETWVNFYSGCIQNKQVPHLYTRASSLLNNLIDSKYNGYDEFGYVKEVFTKESRLKSKKRTSGHHGKFKC